MCTAVTWVAAAATKPNYSYLHCEPVCLRA